MRRVYLSDCLIGVQLRIGQSLTVPYQFHPYHHTFCLLPPTFAYHPSHFFIKTVPYRPTSCCVLAAVDTDVRTSYFVFYYCRYSSLPAQVVGSSPSVNPSILSRRSLKNISIDQTLPDFTKPNQVRTRIPRIPFITVSFRYFTSHCMA